MPNDFNFESARRIARVNRREERLRALETPLPGGSSATSKIIRYSQTGAWQLYPVSDAGLVQCFADTVANDTIDIPVCTLTAPGGAWVINPVEFRVYGHAGMSTLGGTVLSGDWPLNLSSLMFQDLTLVGTSFEEYATLFHCTLSFTDLRIYEAGGGDNELLGTGVCLVQSAFGGMGLHDTRIQAFSGTLCNIDSGLFTGCYIINNDNVNRGIVNLSTAFLSCKFLGKWSVETAAGVGNYAECYKCHFADVSIAFAGGALFNDTTWDAITNRSFVDISEGDRSVYDITGHAASHASDIAAGVLLRHLPAPSVAGKIAIDTGAAWESNAVGGDATLAANGALTVTGIGGVPSSAFWLLAGRAGGQIGYGGTGAGDDATIRSTSNAAKGTVYIADDGGTVQIGPSLTTPQLSILNSVGNSLTIGVDAAGITTLTTAGASARIATASTVYFSAAIYLTTGTNNQFNAGTANATTSVNFDYPNLTTNSGILRFGRNTNTTADIQVIVYKGNNSSTNNCLFSGKGGSYVQADAGNFGIGVMGAAAKLHVILPNATTNAVDTVVIIGHNSSGAVAAGFGGGLKFQLETSTTADVDAASREASWVDHTHATRKARLIDYVYDTAARECIRMEASGTAAMLGFFGVNAVVRPATGGASAAFVQNAGNAVNDASTFGGYTLQQVIQALQNLGLLT